LASYLAYAAVSGVWTDTSSLQVSSGSTLSATQWNQLLGNVQQIKNEIATPVPGTVAQVKAVQTRALSSYTAPATGNGTEITPLDIAITPRKAGNMVILEWVVNGEGPHNLNFLVSRNGTILSDASNALNNRWAAITNTDYDPDNNSTPNEKVIKIVDFNSLGTASTYRLHVRSSYSSALTFYLNRPTGST
jgi:hypothetical protein